LSRAFETSGSGGRWVGDDDCCVRREIRPAADAAPVEVRGTHVAAQAAGTGADEPPIELDDDDDDDEVEDQILAQAMAASMDQEPAVRAPPPRMAPLAGVKTRTPPPPQRESGLASRGREASEL